MPVHIQSEASGETCPVSGTTKTRPTVVIAEDNSLMSARLQLLLAFECKVLAAVADGNALVSAARTHRPQVIVSDIDMPGMSGLEAARIILAEQQEARIVFVTGLNDPEIIRAALSLGVLGFVVKRDVGQELIQAIQSTLERTRYVSNSGWNALGRVFDQRWWTKDEQ
jgi:DNA-binding NarL/FixJ family response regulator